MWGPWIASSTSLTVKYAPGWHVSSVYVMEQAPLGNASPIKMQTIQRWGKLEDTFLRQPWHSSLGPGSCRACLHRSSEFNVNTNLLLKFQPWPVILLREAISPVSVVSLKRERNFSYKPCPRASPLGVLSFTWGNRCRHTQCLPGTAHVGTMNKMAPPLEMSPGCEVLWHCWAPLAIGSPYFLKDG